MKRGHLLVLLLFLALSCTRKEYSISIDGISDYTLSESSVNLRIKVLSDAPSWDYDLGGASWITQQSKSDNLLELSVAANGSPSPRSTTILFTVPTGASASVRVNQQGKPMEPELSVPAEGSLPVSLVFMVTPLLSKGKVSFRSVPSTAQLICTGFPLYVIVPVLSSFSVITTFPFVKPTLVRPFCIVFSTLLLNTLLPTDVSTFSLSKATPGWE